MASPLRDKPPALHDRALQDLSFIRKTMEGAASFTDVPGWGLAIVGVTALPAAYFASLQPTAFRWLATWLAEAVVGATLSAGAMVIKMRRRAPDGTALTIPARKFLLGALPAIGTGAILTLAIAAERTPLTGAPATLAILPGIWMMLYGLGVVSGGAFSVRPVPFMGVTFLLLGALTLMLPGVDGDLMMALSFGAAQIGFGAYIARRHGG